MSEIKQKQEQPKVLFKNVVCKQTYDSLPKIYGQGKSKRSTKQKNSTSLNVIKHSCGIKEQPTLTVKKKPMKFHLQRIQILSAPRYYQYSCNKKNCSCSMHQNSGKRTSLQSAKHKHKKLKPLTLRQTKPDDCQSGYKVRNKSQNSPDKIGTGLLSLIRQHKKQIEQNEQRDQIQYSQKYYEESIVQEVNQLDNFRRFKTQQISYIKNLQSELSNQNQPNPSRTVEIQTLPLLQSRENNKSQINIINNNVQIQVNFSNVLQENKNHQNQQIDKVQNKQQQGRSLLLTNLRSKKYTQKIKKLNNYRKKKFNISNNLQAHSGDEQQSDQVTNNYHNKQQIQQKNNKSRISSSVSINSIVAKGLGQSKTKFRELIEQQDKQISIKTGRSKSINEDGTINIPLRKNYGKYLKNYRAIDKKNFDINKLIKSPLFRIIEQDDSVYFGELENEQKQGSAINITKRQIFEGTYKSNQKVKGSERNIDGIYKGYFVDGKRQGYGTFQWNNGQKFQGNWKAGVKEGFGIWKSPKGDYYEGEWHNNRQQGQGIFRHKNSTYKGQFMNFLKHGQGRQQFINGDLYQGQYKNGKPDGNGTYLWHNGSIYIGGFQQGLRSGQGKLIKKQLTLNNMKKQLGSYQGQFKKDYPWGEGKQIDSRSGQYYIGEFIQGIRVKGIVYNRNGQQKQIIDEIQSEHQSQKE